MRTFFTYVNSTAKPILEIYRGTCNSLELIPDPASCVGDQDDPHRLLNLVMGDTIYIRVVYEFIINTYSLSFCAEPLILCNDDEFIFSPLNVDTFYQVNNVLSSNSLLGNNSHILFQAGNCIELQNGFEVPINHTFHAVIDICE